MIKESLLKEVFEKARKHKRTIVFPESDDERILKAVGIVKKKGIAVPILIGNVKKVKELASQHRVSVKGIEIIDPVTSDKLKEYANEYYELRKEKGVSPEDALKIMKEDIYFGAMMVRKGNADGCVAGASHSSGDTIRAAIQVIQPIDEKHRISGYFLMILKHKTHYKKYLFADCSVMITPSAEELADVAIDTAKSAVKLGLQPKVAMLSFSTKGSAKHPFVDKVREATRIIQKKDPNLMVDGEMQADAALVPYVCRKKCPECKLHGEANVLIFPDLQSGNIGYKLTERLAGAIALGPILQGLKKPASDLSRGCSYKDIVYITAIIAAEAIEARKKK
jgi:phosphate acetyltransferase